MVDFELPEKVNVSKDTSVLAVICQGPCSPDQTPVILGTNGNLFKWLVQLCNNSAAMDIAQAWGITVGNDEVTDKMVSHPVCQ